MYINNLLLGIAFISDTFNVQNETKIHYGNGYLKRTDGCKGIVETKRRHGQGQIITQNIDYAFF